MNVEMRSHNPGQSSGTVAFGTAFRAARSKLAWSGAETIEWVLFWMFIAGLAWCPFWYGGNDPVAWGINAVLFPGLAVIYEVSIVLRGERHPVGVKILWVPAALFVTVLLWIVVQNATWTPSSWHHPVWGLTADALERPIGGSISVNRDLTALALVRLVTAASVFWIAVQLCRNSSRANILVRAVAMIVAAYAAYGLFDFASTMGPDRFATSTFVNRSHFSTYAGMGLVTICALIVRIYRREVAIAGGLLRLRLAAFIEASGRRVAFLLGCAILVLIAAFLTASRGGLLATGLGLFVFGILSFRSQTKEVAGQRMAIVFGAVLLVGAAVMAFGDKLVWKFAERGLSDDSRIAMYVIMLRSIWDAPLLGYGYGTFIDVFPMFRDRSMSVSGIWEHAHNTYLEVFQGFGLVFGSMLVASVVLLVLKCLRGAIGRQESVTVPLIATSVAFLVGVHALSDFSLEMQAVTLTFMALLGAGVAQSESSRLALGD